MNDFYITIIVLLFIVLGLLLATPVKKTKPNRYDDKVLEFRAGKLMEVHK